MLEAGQPKIMQIFALSENAIFALDENGSVYEWGKEEVPGSIDLNIWIMRIPHNRKRR